MEPFVARGFFTLLISPEQIQDLKILEKKLPRGRYLQGFEVGRRYGVEGGEVEESRMSKMDGLYRTWQAKRHKDAVDMDVIDEIHAWMDFVLKNWHEPLPSLKRRAADKFSGYSAVVLMLMLCR